MRLACPNCGAEYEVPDGLVPEGGKHVQCTDCDTRWFVRGGRDEVVSEDQLIERLEKWRPRLVTTGGAATAAGAVEPAAPPDPEPVPEPEPEPEPRFSEPEPVREPALAPAPSPDAAVAPEDPKPAATPSPAMTELTGDAGRVDAGPDLTDDGPPEDFVWEDSQGAVEAEPDPVPPARPSPPERPAAPPPPPVPPAAAPVFRPVVAPEPVDAPSEPAGPDASGPSKSEEPETAAFESGADDPDARPIRGRTRNSHRIELPEDGARTVMAPEPPTEPDRFRTGLFVALALFFLALLIYATRDAIVATVPAVEPAISGYAGAVDGLREGFDRIVAPDG